MMPFRNITVASLMMLLSACASGPKMSDVATTLPKVPEGQGRVYFYRTQIGAAAVQPTIRVNGNGVGDCQPDGAFFSDLPPGAYKASVSTEVERELTFTLDAKEEKFVRCHISIGLFVGHGNLELIDPATAKAEIADLHYVGK